MSFSPTLFPKKRGYFVPNFRTQFTNKLTSTLAVFVHQNDLKENETSNEAEREGVDKVFLVRLSVDILTS